VAICTPDRVANAITRSRAGCTDATGAGFHTPEAADAPGRSRALPARRNFDNAASQLRGETQLPASPKPTVDEQYDMKSKLPLFGMIW
jgi:hypothetical protein